MLSNWRLPWCTEPGGDNAVLDMALPQKPRQKPTIDIPLFNKAKRRRMDSIENVSPQSAPVLKKMKNAQGSVRTKLEPASIKARLAHTAPATDIITLDEGECFGQEMIVPAQVKDACLSQVQPVQHVKEEVRSGESIVPSLPTPPNQDPEILQTRLQDSENSEELAGSMDSNLSTVRQIIEAQFSLEILLKHDELRLVEQELAKCQVALEQLRRCQLIPYPGTSGPSLDVSSGIGVALQPPTGYSLPRQPAPWGVTDGPYTRHYAQWLIPDGNFDPYPKHVSQHSGSGWPELTSGRATRASEGDFSRSRSSRVSTVSKHSLLPQDPSSPTAFRDPLVLKRSTDNKWVKLYCDQCTKENFANVQGFINHYRISHRHGFETHDAAAIACGRPIEVDESYDTPVAKDRPAKPPIPSAERPLVHPFINAPPKTDGTVIKRILDQLSRYQNPSVHKAATTPRTPASAHPFVGSSQTPYLSTLLQKRSFSGNLEQAVGEASTKIDLDTVEPIFSDDEAETPCTEAPPANFKGGKKISSGHTVPSTRPAHQSVQTPTSMLHRQTGHGARPTSRKGAGMHFTALTGFSSGDHAYSSPYRRNNGATPFAHTTRGVLHASHDSRAEIPESPLEMELSPNTVESNPGLVSDREDEDEEDEEETEHAAPERDMDVEMMEVEIEDASDVEGGRKRLRREHDAGQCSRKA